jgi:hypothetical protein
MDKKQDEREDKEAMSAFNDMLEALSESIEASKQKYINLMVDCMVVEAKIIQDARKEGVEFNVIMPEVKEAYMKRVKEMAQKNTEEAQKNTTK